MRATKETSLVTPGRMALSVALSVALDADSALAIERVTDAVCVAAEAESDLRVIFARAPDSV
jgi:hypothetical protein